MLANVSRYTVLYFHIHIQLQYADTVKYVCLVATVPSMVLQRCALMVSGLIFVPLDLVQHQVQLPEHFADSILDNNLVSNSSWFYEMALAMNLLLLDPTCVIQHLLVLSHAALEEVVEI